MSDPRALRLPGGAELSDEQAGMAWRICGQGCGVDLVEGVAGAGKTFALAAANDA